MSYLDLFRKAKTRGYTNETSAIWKQATDVDMSETVETAVLNLLKDFVETID